MQTHYYNRKDARCSLWASRVVWNFDTMTADQAILIMQNLTFNGVMNIKKQTYYISRVNGKVEVKPAYDPSRRFLYGCASRDRIGSTDSGCRAQ